MAAADTVPLLQRINPRRTPMKDLDLSMLTKTEVAVYRLRALFKEHGYTPYKMSKFEA